MNFNDLERSLINFLFYDVNRMRFFVNDEIFEYDIQSSIHKYIKATIDRKNFKVNREKDDRTDISIYDLTDNKTILIEIKSFIKKHESFSITKIKSDLNKLSKKLNAEKYNSSSGYLIICCKQKHLLSKRTKGNKVVTELLGKKRIIFFDDIKTRVIRSYQTMFLKGQNSIPHTGQIKVFMFQVLSV